MNEELHRVAAPAQEIFPGVRCRVGDWANVPVGDADWFEVRFDMTQITEPADKVPFLTFSVLKHPQRMQRRRWWTAFWSESSHQGFRVTESDVVTASSLDGIVPTTSLNFERYYVQRVDYHWSNWQYELEQVPEGFLEFAQEKGWLP